MQFNDNKTFTAISNAYSLEIGEKRFWIVLNNNEIVYSASKKTTAFCADDFTECEDKKVYQSDSKNTVLKITDICKIVLSGSGQSPNLLVRTNNKEYIIQPDGKTWNVHAKFDVSKNGNSVFYINDKLVVYVTHQNVAKGFVLTDVRGDKFTCLCSERPDDKILELSLHKMTGQKQLKRIWVSIVGDRAEFGEITNYIFEDL